MIWKLLLAGFILTLLVLFSIKSETFFGLFCVIVVTLAFGMLFWMVLGCQVL